MTKSAFLSACARFDCPPPTFVEESDPLEVWDFNGRTYFKYLVPLEITLPAAFLTADGLYRIDTVEDCGLFAKGIVTKMSGEDFLTSHLLRTAPLHAPKKKFPTPVNLGRTIRSVEDYCLSFGGIVIE